LSVRHNVDKQAAKGEGKPFHTVLRAGSLIMHQSFAIETALRVMS